MTASNQLGGEDHSALDDLVFFAIMLGTPTVVGRLLRLRADLPRATARAEALRAAQEAEAAAAMAQERARLALAVHDAVAQRVGEIALQAAGAQQQVGTQPARALAALARIEATARAVLDEIPRRHRRAAVAAIICSTWRGRPRTLDGSDVAAAGARRAGGSSRPGSHVWTSRSPPSCSRRWRGRELDLVTYRGPRHVVNARRRAAVAARSPCSAAPLGRRGEHVRDGRGPSLVVTSPTVLVTPRSCCCDPSRHTPAAAQRSPGCSCARSALLAALGSVDRRDRRARRGRWRRGRVVRDRGLRVEELCALTRRLEARRSCATRFARGGGAPAAWPVSLQTRSTTA